MACLKKAEDIVLKMQDPNTGVKSQPQKLSITTIPHAMTGADIVLWLANHFTMTTQEGITMGTMLLAYGYIYPLQNHKVLVMKNEASSLYRYQTPYFWPAQQWDVEDSDYAIYLAKKNIRKRGALEPHEQVAYDSLHKWLNHKWDFIVMQAKEQYRAGKERKKPDRVVFDCQERAYWVVHRGSGHRESGPVTVSGMDYGLARMVDPNEKEDRVKRHEYYRRDCIYTEASIRRPRVKSSVSLSALQRYSVTQQNHDPLLSPCLPSNPWVSDDDTYWVLNLANIDLPTKARVERWTFSFQDLLNDPRGRNDFRLFLKKEFSGENLAFWEACEEVRLGSMDVIEEKAQEIYKTFLTKGAPRWINIDMKTMDATVKGLKHPHRYIMEPAQTHIYQLMKKDSYGRYLKSQVFKDTQKNAVNPTQQIFTEAEIARNAKKRRSTISPLVTRQMEEEAKAREAASGKVDMTQVMSKLSKAPPPPPPPGADRKGSVVDAPGSKRTSVA